MLIKATQLCICGHRASAHTYGVFFQMKETSHELELPTLEYVQDHCTVTHTCKTNCKMFKLDNLGYIEQEAKRRNLV